MAVKHADFEEGTKADLQASNAANTVNTFAGFGIPALTGGGSYCVDCRSTSGVDDADMNQLTYDFGSNSDAFVRLYFFIPTGFIANQSQANSLKFVMVRYHLTGDQDVYLFQNGAGATGSLRFNWQHSIVGYNSGDMVGEITRNQWHILEIRLNQPANKVYAWFDHDARSDPFDWENNTGLDGDYPNPTNVVQLNDNWSGGNAPATQKWFCDGLSWSNVALGDTYGLLTSPNPVLGAVGGSNSVLGGDVNLNTATPPPPFNWLRITR